MSLHPTDWNSLIQDLRSVLNMAKHSNDFVKALNESEEAWVTWLKCGNCGTKFYLEASSFSQRHFAPNSSPPQVACYKCKHSSSHSYEDVGTV